MTLKSGINIKQLNDVIAQHGNKINDSTSIYIFTRTGKVYKNHNELLKMINEHGFNDNIKLIDTTIIHEGNLLEASQEHYKVGIDENGKPWFYDYSTNVEDIQLHEDIMKKQPPL